MKKILLIVITGFILAGCADKKAQKKAVLDEVIKIHDRVMGADEQLEKNKLLLDSMVKHNSTADIKDSVYLYLTKVNLADSNMSVWMHKFDPDQTGKTDEEALKYFTDQKKQITVIDSQLNSAVNQSNKYLIKMKMK